MQLRTVRFRKAMDDLRSMLRRKRAALGKVIIVKLIKEHTVFSFQNNLNVFYSFSLRMSSLQKEKVHKNSLCFAVAMGKTAGDIKKFA